MFTTRGMRRFLGYNACCQINRQFHGANIRSIERIINVPLLGESITEGSIAKWNMQIGDKVKVDDIVVSIETDKITVDVRSPYHGVITKHFGDPADSVNVGGALFAVDADASEGRQTPEPENFSVGSALSARNDAQPAHAHRPLIRFIGKRSRGSQIKAAGLPFLQDKPESNPLHFDDNFPTFGRPELLESEIDAINSGGSSLML